MTNREALEIAHSYGFRLRTDGALIRENLAFARENDGKHGKSATRYFDDYLGEMARCFDCDGRAAESFQRNAY